MDAKVHETTTNGRLTEIADSLDCLTELDLLLLADINPGTLEAWRKRGEGPGYVRAGNRFLYPRVEVTKWLSGRVRERNSTSVREQL